MNSTRKAWIVATSIGVVEALKDQGICRWNSTLRSIQQKAKTNLRTYNSQTKKLSSAQCSNAMSKMDDKLKKSEETLRAVMYLSCWGPNN